MKSKTKVRKNLPAFTLIEVVVVIAIIGITSVIFLTSWNSGRTASLLESAARQVEAVVRSAQNYALTGAQGVAATEPCVFKTTWVGVNYSTVYYYKDGSGNCTQSSVLNTYTLGNGVTFDSAGNFDFTVPHAAVSFGGASQAIVLTKSNVYHTVCVYQNGRITHVVGAVCP